MFFVLVSALTLTVLFSSEASKFLPKTVQEQIGQILDKFGLEPRVHAVVIDAGSTGIFFILSTKFEKKTFQNEANISIITKIVIQAVLCLRCF